MGQSQDFPLVLGRMEYYRGASTGDDQMDGIGMPPPPPPGAPTNQSVPGYAPYAPGSYPPGAPTLPNPQGRPSKDPDAQERRAKDAAALGKFMEALPKEATDYRVAVYRLKGKRGMQREHRPVLRILLSELEEQTDTGGDPKDYIQNRLSERYGERPGRFICIAQNAHGKPIDKIAPFEITLNMDGEDDEMEEDDEYEDIPVMDSPFGPNGEQQDDVPWWHKPPPGAPRDPPPDVMVQATALLDRQRNSEQSNTALMLGMFQNMQQQAQQSSQMMTTMLMTMNQDRERREAEQRDRERQEREARDREERSRSENRVALFAALAPALAPVLNRVVEGRKDEVTPVLLAKLLDSDNNRQGAHELIALMSEASKQQVLMQGEMARQNMQQQAETNKSMISHVLQMAQQSVEAQRALDANREEGPMDTFANILSAVTPLLQNAQGAPSTGTMPQPMPQAAPPQPHPRPAPPPRPAPVDQPAEAQARRPQEGQQPSRETHPHYSDADWIRASLTTIRQMHAGQIPPEQRWAAMQWMATVLPHNLLQAIASNDEQQVQVQCMEAVLSDQTITNWLLDDGEEYLREIISDFGMLLRQEVSELQAQDAINRERHRLQHRGGGGGSSPRPGTGKTPPPPVEDTAQAEIISEEVDEWPASNGPDGPPASDSEDKEVDPEPVETTASVISDEERAENVSDEG